MQGHSSLRILTGSVLVLASLCGWARADVFAFDPSGDGAGYGHFDELAGAYRDFMGSGTALIDLNGLSIGETLEDQYLNDYGVRFLNAMSVKHGSKTGIHAEGDSMAANLTGYDETYMPDGDWVYVKFDNDLLNSPFTITFDEPVDLVGAFLGMGVQGDVHSLTVSAYDENDQVLGEFAVDSWLWETKSSQQNYETFFGVRSDTPSISKVEIRNDGTGNFANKLTFDNLEFGRGGSGVAIPETGTAFLLIAGVLQMFGGRRLAGSRSRRSGRD